ncbi:MAG: hypothetical protein LRZ84_10550 [Desertifilum sp.]|nr:hypothetical protein [Desertifilum sp.]
MPGFGFGTKRTIDVIKNNQHLLRHLSECRKHEGNGIMFIGSLNGVMLLQYISRDFIWKGLEAKASQFEHSETAPSIQKLIDFIDGTDHDNQAVVSVGVIEGEDMEFYCEAVSLVECLERIRYLYREVCGREERKIVFSG